MLQKYSKTIAFITKQIRWRGPQHNDQKHNIVFVECVYKKDSKSYTFNKKDSKTGETFTITKKELEQ